MMVFSTSANKILLSFNAPSRKSQEEFKVCSFAIAELIIVKQDIVLTCAHSCVSNSY